MLTSLVIKMLQIQQGRTMQTRRTAAIRRKGTLKITVCTCNRMRASGLKEMYSY